MMTNKHRLFYLNHTLLDFETVDIQEVNQVGIDSVLFNPYILENTSTAIRNCQAQDSQDILNLLELKGETRVSYLSEN